MHPPNQSGESGSIPTRALHIRGRLAWVDARSSDPRLDDSEQLAAVLVDACSRARASVLRVVHERLRPKGATALVALAESHAAAHTHPELGGLMLDVCTFGEDIDPAHIAELVVRELRGTVVASGVLCRGLD